MPIPGASKDLRVDKQPGEKMRSGDHSTALSRHQASVEEFPWNSMGPLLEEFTAVSKHGGIMFIIDQQAREYFLETLEAAQAVRVIYRGPG
jgi:hypothetical protein